LYSIQNLKFDFRFFTTTFCCSSVFQDFVLYFVKHLS